MSDELRQRRSEQFSAGSAAEGASLEATCIALLIPSDSRAEAVVVLDGGVAPQQIVVKTFGPSQSFSRIRQGAIVHGMAEPFSQSRYFGGASVGPMEIITLDRYYSAHFEKASSLFGSVDTAVFLPRDANGRVRSRVSIPVPSLERPARVNFELVDSSAVTCTYALDGEPLFGTGFICPVCGKACETPEPHTAQHGLPGHVRAGFIPGESQDETRGFPHRLDDPGQHIL
ncbi:MAG: hypothetical protein ACYCZK_05080 [Microbacteriaceae bacterium]